MEPTHARLALLAGLLLSSGLLLVYPIEPAMSTEILFDDAVDARIEAESMERDSNSQLVLRFRHDEGGSLSDNLSRVHSLMQLEKEAKDGSNPSTAWDAEHISFKRIETPFQAWSQAFASRNRSLENASQWADVMLPIIEQGWCGNGSTPAEKAAFEATLLLLPSQTEHGVACPSFPGASASQPPRADEVLWVIWLETDEEYEDDWAELADWAQKITTSTEFEVSPVGVNMMFSEVKEIAEDDLNSMILPLLTILLLVLAIGLRDPLAAVVTVAGAGLAVGAELGLLSLLGFTFTVIDGIALPIIMGVAVDGAFWYCRSSRDRQQVRSMLFVAMMTTIAAVSLSMLSPIKAQRSLGLVMAIGIFFTWLVSRFILEDFFLGRRLRLEVRQEEGKGVDNGANDGVGYSTQIGLSWCWPIALVLLASVVVISPGGVEPLDVEQFLPADSSTLKEMEELESKYIMVASTVAWVLVDVDGNSTEDLQQVRDFQSQLSQHPSIINLDTGLYRTPMVLGISFEDNGQALPTIDSVSSQTEDSLLIGDPRLQRDGETSGIAIMVLLDGQKPDEALQFSEDVHDLLQYNGLQGDVGGDLPIAAEIAYEFEKSRMSQILAAGVAVFLVSYVILGSPIRAARIAIGTIAVGACVDGLASLLGGRGINTAFAVLLGMGFTADYLSHASAEHVPTKNDTYARWGAAATSVSVFALLAMATFPPARDTGQLLTVSVLLSVILATFLAFTHQPNSAAHPQ